MDTEISQHRKLTMEIFFYPAAPSGALALMCAVCCSLKKTKSVLQAHRDALNKQLDTLQFEQDEQQ